MAAALSVVVHGITVKESGLPNNGRLSASDITTDDGTDYIVYTVPILETKYLIFSVSVCNRLPISQSKISIAVSPNDVPIDSEFVEWNATLVPYGVLERTQMVANPGDRIIVRVGP